MKKSKKKQKKTAPKAPAPHYFASAGPHLLLIAIIAFVAILVYSNTFKIPFQFDDQISILGNAAVKDISNLKAIFQFSPTRFFTYLTFACNYYFNELHVFGYHLVNIIIHICASLLVMWFVCLTFATPAVRDTPPAAHKKSIAFLAALLFAVHPVQTQAVTYIVQRLASLATLFYLATLCLYIKGRLLQQDGTAQKYSICFFSAAAVTAIIGMFTKETVFTLPFAILLYEFFFFRSTFIYNCKFLGLVIAFALFIPAIILSTGSIDFNKLRAMQEGPEGILYISPLEYFLTQLRVLITYLRLVILPINQNLDYDYPVAHTFFNVQTMTSLLLLLAMAAAGIKLFAKHRLIAFAIFWFFLTLSIESSFIPIRDIIFEHRLYLPMAGLSVSIVIMLYHFLWRKNARLFYTVMVIILFFCAMLTYARNNVWQDEVTLWHDTIEKSPRKVRPYNNRGRAYGNRGEYDKAMNDFKRAIEINPRCAEAYYNLGLVFALKGDDDTALKHYDQALKLYPNYAAAYNNRGLVLANKKQFDRAIKDYAQALRITPRSPDVYYNRGLAYYYKQDYEQAIADYSQALLLNPRYSNAYHNRAIAYYMKKDYQKALEDIERMQQMGFKIDPKFLNTLRSKIQ
jgi:Tfp pilus assembly protein PilF